MAKLCYDTDGLQPVTVQIHYDVGQGLSAMEALHRKPKSHSTQPSPVRGLSLSYERALRSVQELMALTLLGVGAFILGGGAERFATPTYAIPRNLLPWWGWSIVFIVVGAVLAISSALHSRWTLLWNFIAGSTYLFFAVAISMSIIFERVDAATVFRAVSAPIPAYLGLGVTTIFVGMVLQWEAAESLRLRIMARIRRKDRSKSEAQS